MKLNPFRFDAALLILACILAPARILLADGTTRQSFPNSTPLLQELDAETRSLYRQVEPGIVRVQLPVTRPSDAEVLVKWQGVLSPEMRYELEHQEVEQTTGMSRVSILPTTRPDEAMPAGYVPANSANEPPHIFPNVIGVVLDNEGHVFLPVWVDKYSLGGKPIPVLLSNGVESQATFVGSDHQTNVTILQVDGLSVSPVKLAPTRPPDGALVLIYSVGRAMTSLSVWTSDSVKSGLVVNVDGTVAGFARPDDKNSSEFLCAYTCLPVARQLIEFGRVNRAFLGVRIVPVGPADPERLRNPALGQLPSIRITEVLPDSAADQAGLREGDLILAMAGDSVDNPPTFSAAIAARSGKTDLTILRGQREMNVTVDLEPPRN